MTDDLFDNQVSLPGWLAGPLSRIRRNHGLEHATLHVLAEKHPGLRMAGHSDRDGFWVLGDLDTQELAEAVQLALRRLHGGDEKLAVHPFCGTNFATSGLMAGIAASLAWLGVGSRARDKMERLPLAITLATLALIASQPLGLIVQARLTTSGKPGNLQVVEIRLGWRGRIKAHRVITQG